MAKARLASSRKRNKKLLRGLNLKMPVKILYQNTESIQNECIYMLAEPLTAILVCLSIALSRRGVSSRGFQFPATSVTGVCVHIYLFIIHPCLSRPPKSLPKGEDLDMEILVYFWTPQPKLTFILGTSF